MEHELVDAPKQAQLPKFYRFRTLGSNYMWDELDRGILCSEIYFPEFEKMNDPFEGAPRLGGVSTTVKLVELQPAIISLTQAAIDLYGVRPLQIDPFEFVKDLAQQALAVAHEKPWGSIECIGNLQRHIRCVSLTRNVSSILMWAHYSQGFSGYCLEYESQLSMVPGLYPLHMNEVEYTTARPEITSLEYVKFLMFGFFVKALSRNWTGRESWLPYGVASSHFEEHFYPVVRKLILTKSSDWKIENEWRMFDFAERGEYIMIDNMNVVAIIFGPRSQPKLMEVIGDRYGTRVTLTKVELDREEYKFGGRSLRPLCLINPVVPALAWSGRSGSAAAALRRRSWPDRARSPSPAGSPATRRRPPRTRRCRGSAP